MALAHRRLCGPTARAGSSPSVESPVPRPLARRRCARPAGGGGALGRSGWSDHRTGAPGSRKQAGSRVLDFLDRTDVVHLWEVVDLVHRVYAAGRHASLFHALHPLVDRVRRGRLVDQGLQLVPVGDTIEVAGEARVLGIDPDARGEPPPQALGTHGDVDPPVGTPEGAIGGDGGVPIALEPDDLATQRPARALVGVHGHGRCQQRRRHPLAAAGALAFVQRAHHTPGAEHARQDVGDRHAELGGLATGMTGHRHQAGFALHDLVEPRPGPVGTALAESRDRQHDQALVQCGQRLLAQPQSVHDTGTEVLDQHVGSCQQVPQHAQVVGVLEIQRHGHLVAIDTEEVGGLALVALPQERRTPPAAVVATVRTLHLDHLGTGVGQHQRRIGPGKCAREVDDPDPGQWAGRVGGRHGLGWNG